MKKVKFIILLLLVVLFSKQNFGQAGFFIDPGQKKITIPFQLHSNLILIPLILNNRLPMKFIVDTGVRNAILTEKTYTDMLNVGYSRKYTIRGAGGDFLIDAYLTNGVSLSLPGLEGKGTTLLVLEEDYIELRNFLGTSVHGMLGYEIFSRFIVEINYAKKLLILHKPNQFKPKRRYQKVSISIEDTKPFINLPIEFQNGSVINAKMLIDTGASHGIMLEPQSGDSVTVTGRTIDAVIGRGLGGVIEGQISRLNNLNIGNYNLENPIVTFPYPNSYMDSLLINTTFRNGSIGGEVLSRFNIIFDYGNGVMYFKKNSKFRKKFHYNLSGLTVKAIGSGLEVFVIDQVRESSTAYKNGLRIGDVIHSINGVSADMLSLNSINSILNSKPNKKIKIVINRGTDQKKIMFRLASPI